MTDKKLETRAVVRPNEVKEENGVTTISGHAAVFGNIDSHGDIIERGAFAKTIRDAQSRKINLFSSHSMDARDLLGTVVTMMEDDFGLFFRAEISQSESAQDIALKAREGHLDEISIGFFINDQEFVKQDDGSTIRAIKEIDLIEISLVSRASNPKARTLVVKHDSKENDVEEKQEEKVEEAKVEVKAAEQAPNEQLTELMAEVKALKETLAKPIKKTPAAVVETKAEAKKEEKNMTNPTDGLFHVVKGMMSNREYNEMVCGERKELAATVSTSGGVLVPETLLEQILIKKDQINRIQSRVSRMAVKGPITMADFDFSETFINFAENSSLGVDNIINAFGKTTLTPRGFGVIVKMSRQIERQAFASMESFISQRYAVAYVNQLEQHIIRGTGQNQPLGIVTNLDTLAVNTTDVTANISAVTYADMVDLVMSLEEQYRVNGVILASRDALSALRKLTDSQNLPVWNLPVAAGQPATFLGHPIFESPALELGTSVGETPIIFGDYSQYMLAEDEAFRLEVLRELFAEKDQIGLKMVASYDGSPMDKNAFARIEIV